MTPSRNGTIAVWIASRFSGGVSITDMSRMPARDICRVRGIGVAVSVRTSTSFFIALIASLCATPKRCSSSTTRSPRSRKRTSFESRRWVPIRTSTLPSARAFRIALCSRAVRKRETISMVVGQEEKRSRKVARCWKARTVVGHRTATCLPPMTALKAARMATSVLPNPTSPQIRRYIGASLSMSALTSLIALAWPGVSS